MYPHMIEVHNVTSNYPISVNIENITKIYDDGLPDMSEKWGIISFVRGNDISTKETYDELKQLIRDAGCLIHKADPRLENKCLTMDDLKKMTGEPVWNSNNGQWYLVHSCYRNKIFLTTKMGTHWEFPADDLEKYPLYRMKVQNDPISD